MTFKEFTGINEEASVTEVKKLIKEINALIEKAILNKDKKTLDILVKDLDKIIKSV